jgi:mono/diheme cytochrome c family protein
LVSLVFKNDSWEVEKMTWHYKQAKWIVVLAAWACGCLFYQYGGYGAETVSAQKSGGVVYAQNCARCHGADGRAQTRKGKQVDATDFTGGEWLPDTARDTRIVTRGKGSMPAFKGKLSAAEINAVVSYIRRFKG